MAELSQAQKLEIVTMLACYREPVAIIAYFVETYLDLAPMPFRQILAYDPTSPHYDAGEKWLDIFDAKRKQYLEEVASVPIANQGFRLQMLQEELKRALKDNKSPLAILEQAAKEVGGVLTNMRDVRIDDSRRQRAAEMTPEDRRGALAGIIADLMASRDPPGTEPAAGTVQ